MTIPPPSPGYFTGPTASPGPGVLYLHSAWGLSPTVKENCDRLGALGYTVLAPDLADGVLPDCEEDAWSELAGADMNILASLVQSSALLLRGLSADPTAGLAVIGYSSGASWALWLAARFPEVVSSVVTFYGTQSIDFTPSRAEYLCHFASEDTVVTDFEVADLGLRLQQAGRTFRIEHHEGAEHGFAESGLDSFDGKAEAVAWRQTTEFLADQLGVNST